jgi:uncharacterized protein YjbI with pentapeptide repeats
VSTVRLTRQELLDAGADCDGLQVFDVLARRQSAAADTLNYEWTQERQIWCLLCEDIRRHVGWLIRMGLLPRIRLNWANLYGADLSGADLRGVDLSGADLREANLCRADLRGAKMRGADLSGADLCEAKLYEANLYSTNLCGANLRGANLYGADLRRADLSGVWRFSDDAWIPGWELHDGQLRRTS